MINKVETDRCTYLCHDKQRRDRQMHISVMINMVGIDRCTYLCHDKHGSDRQMHLSLS